MIKRYKWAVVLITALGTALVIGVTRFTAPEYVVRAKVWISGDSNLQRERGPIRAEELLPTSSWGELLTASTILDRVTRKHTLLLTPKNSADSVAFVGFGVGTGLRTSAY